jgi:acetolactate synthase-1/2/3 large subunit
MGYGFPAALGAQAAFPDSLVVNIDGDGSFQMTMQDLCTLLEYELPVKTFIINNKYLGMVRQWQQLFYGQRYSQVNIDHQPDFVKLAEAFGITGIRIERPEEVKAGIEKAISTPGPVVVDVVVDREENCFPMIPAGAAIKDIIDVGEPIPDKLFQGWR